jgi:hypothetical protein
MARTELNRRAYWLFNKSAELRFLAKQMANLIVGPARFPIAQTSDQEWNELAEDFFDNWASNPILCDARRQSTFWARQRLCVTDDFRQGEAFVAKVSTKTAWPNFQSLNSTRVLNVGKPPEGFELWDGVLLDSNGKNAFIAAFTTPKNVEELSLAPRATYQQVVTDPQSGISVLLYEWIEPKNMQVIRKALIMYGVAVADPAALVAVRVDEL